MTGHFPSSPGSAADNGAYRDPVTGRFDYDDNFDRLCKCGHSLGVHSQGGYYCGTDAIGNKEPEAIGCKCERFRPSGKRRAPSTFQQTRQDTDPTVEKIEELKRSGHDDMQIAMYTRGFREAGMAKMIDSSREDRRAERLRDEASRLDMKDNPISDATYSAQIPSLKELESAALPGWDDPEVQIVYEALCQTPAPLNEEEHWEGWVSRHIVQALRGDAYTSVGTREVLDALADKVSAKIGQLEHYKANAAQLDHARTIAEGRILQANQILHWIAEAAVQHSPSVTSTDRGGE